MVIGLQRLQRDQEHTIWRQPLKQVEQILAGKGQGFVRQQVLLQKPAGVKVILQRWCTLEERFIEQRQALGKGPGNLQVGQLEEGQMVLALSTLNLEVHYNGSIEQQLILELEVARCRLEAPS